MKTLGQNKRVGIKKPWIIEDMIEMIDERRKWENVKIKGGCKRCMIKGGCKRCMYKAVNKQQQMQQLVRWIVHIEKYCTCLTEGRRNQ